MGVTVRHNAKLAAAVALLAGVMTVAWFARALQTGRPLDWGICVVVAAIGLLQLLVVRDSRSPLMVADELGVRVRRGETWSGLRWQDIEHVEVASPGSWLQDGRIVVHPRAVPAHLDPFDEVEGDVATLTEAPSRETFEVALGTTTRLDFEGLTGDLVSDLDALASGQTPVLVLSRLAVEPAEKTERAPRSLRSRRSRAAEAPVVEQQEEWFADEESAPAADPDLEPMAEPAPLPEPEALQAPADTEEPVEDAEAHQARETPEADEQDRAPEPDARTELKVRWRARAATLLAARLAGSPQDHREDAEADLDADPTDDTAVRSEGPLADAEDETGAEPVADTGADAGPATEEFEPVEPVRAARPAARSEVLRDTVRSLPPAPAIPAQRTTQAPVLVARVDDFGSTAVRSREDAVIGPLVAAARHRARLSIDTLSERTRIRPHVLECIEVDDFAACGGDFYARGHLRTLARVFGLDAEELVGLYDEHYAHAEIEARQVFEAELATGIGGGVRATHTGPRWSLLAACVLALASVWGVARVFNDTPQELVSPAPGVVDSAGLTAGAEKSDKPASSLAPIEVRAVGASPQVVVRDRSGRILWAGKLAAGQRQQVIGQAPFEVTASNGEAVRLAVLGKAKGSVGESADAASRQVG